MSKPQTNYQTLKHQLDEIIASLQDEQLDIDEAIKLHEQGQKVIVQLEKYLDKTKHRFEVIKPEK